MTDKLVDFDSIRVHLYKYLQVSCIDDSVQKALSWWVKQPEHNA
jgi:hypothetical protein